MAFPMQLCETRQTTKQDDVDFVRCENLYLYSINGGGELADDLILSMAFYLMTS